MDDRPLCPVLKSCGGGEGEQYKPTRTKKKSRINDCWFHGKKISQYMHQTTNQDVVHVVRLA